ncbi:MAG TPA: hypothetical protein VLB09_00120 [Nitrospiria bacterium]|nr:hypothetical protein [Nitrospiria bacterium]
MAGPARISIDQESDGDPLIFRVEVHEGGGSTAHQVTMSGQTYRELTGGKVTPERLIAASFEYLLERERKEAILSTFDLTLITSFFPQYSGDIKSRLGT